MPMPALAPITDTPAPALRVLPDPTTEGRGAPEAPTTLPRSRSKLNLGGTGTTATAAKAGKTYPEATLDDIQRAHIDSTLFKMEQEKSLKADKATVNEWVVPQWFARAQGQLEPPSSIIVPGVMGTGMLVVAGDTGGRYMGTAEAAAADRLAAIVGEDAFAETFTEKVTFKIDLEKVPEDRQQALVDALVAVVRAHGAEQAMTAKPLWTFTPIGRKARYTRFSLEQNLAIHAILPVVPSFKARK